MGPQTPFYFETGHCCQPQMAGMDHGAWKNLQTQGGLQEYFYLESLGKKKKNKNKRRKREVTYHGQCKALKSETVLIHFSIIHPSWGG